MTVAGRLRELRRQLEAQYSLMTDGEWDSLLDTSAGAVPYDMTARDEATVESIAEDVAASAVSYLEVRSHASLGTQPGRASRSRRSRGGYLKARVKTALFVEAVKDVARACQARGIATRGKSYWVACADTIYGRHGIRIRPDALRALYSRHRHGSIDSPKGDDLLYALYLKILEDEAKQAKRDYQEGLQGYVELRLLLFFTHFLFLESECPDADVGRFRVDWPRVDSILIAAIEDFRSCAPDTPQTMRRAYERALRDCLSPGGATWPFLHPPYMGVPGARGKPGECSAVQRVIRTLLSVRDGDDTTFWPLPSRTDGTSA